MIDRPRSVRLERLKGQNVLRDSDAGYYRALSLHELAAIVAEGAALIELDVICEGRIPPRHTLAEGDRPHSKSPS